MGTVVQLLQVFRCHSFTSFPLSGSVVPYRAAPLTRFIHIIFIALRINHSQWKSIVYFGSSICTHVMEQVPAFFPLLGHKIQIHHHSD